MIMPTLPLGRRHAEGLPMPDNRIMLDPDVRDARGLPVGRLTYEWCDNDLRLAAAARDKAAEMMDASGARQVRIGLNYGARHGHLPHGPRAA